MPNSSSFSAPQQPLTVIWRRHTLDRVPEAQFIHTELLGRLGRPIRVLTVEHMQDMPFMNSVLIVSLTTESWPYLAEARRRGHKALALFHLGDEQGTDDLSAYESADQVFRNYWFDAIQTRPNVTWVPNGYGTGIGPVLREALLPSSARTRKGFFAGSIGMRALSDERRAMSDVVARAGLPVEMHAVKRASDRLGPASYASRLANSVFALVPGGNSPETIRLYDALENGAIPIMLRSRFVDTPAALSNPPIVLLESWSQLPDLWNSLLADCPTALDQRQAEILSWWDAFKTCMQSKVRNKINDMMFL